MNKVNEMARARKLLCARGGFEDRSDVRRVAGEEYREGRPASELAEANEICRQIPPWALSAFNMKKVLIILGILIFLVAVEFAWSRYFDGYPVGFHKGYVVLYRWSCFDVCLGGWKDWGKEYYGVATEEECKTIGGVSFHNWAWGGGYIGCMPNH